jgi:hypothetical protein
MKNTASLSTQSSLPPTPATTSTWLLATGLTVFGLLLQSPVDMAMANQAIRTDGNMVRLESMLFFKEPDCLPKPALKEQRSRMSNEDKKLESYEFYECLNSYARELLADPQANGTPMRNPLVRDVRVEGASLRDFNIRISSIDTTCFKQAPTKNLQTRLVDQIRSSALFLRDFYARTEGQSQGILIVRDIEICSKETLGRDLHIQGNTLSIGLPQRGFLEHRKMMSIWNDGDAYFDVSTGFFQAATRFINPVDSASRKLQWSLLNPLGTIRSSIRNTLKEVAQDFVSRLTRRSERENPVHLLVSEVRRSSLSTSGLVSVQDFDALSKLSTDEAQTVLESWTARLDDTESLEALFSSVLSLKGRNSSFNIDRDVIAVVGVSNWHHIGTRVSVQVVKAQMSENTLSRMLDSMRGSHDQIEALTVQHRYKFRGLVSVDTIDHIQTDLDVLVETAGSSTVQVLKDATLFMALDANGLISL